MMPHNPHPPRPQAPGIPVRTLAIVGGLGVLGLAFVTLIGLGVKQRDAPSPIDAGTAVPTVTAPAFHDERERAAQISRSLTPRYTVRDRKRVDFRDIQKPGAPLVP